MWEKLSGTILRNRLVLIAFLVLVTALMLFKATQVEVAYDNPKFVPDDDPEYIAYTNFLKEFGDDGNVMVVGIRDAKINELEFFQEWYHLTEKLEASPGIQRVLSLTNVRSIVLKTVTNEIDGVEFENAVFADQLLLEHVPENQEDLDDFFAKVHELRFYEGLLFTDSSDFTMIALTLDKSILDTKERINFVNGIKSTIKTVCDAHEVETHFSGLPYIRTVMSIKIQEELRTFTLISILITSLILLFFFRSFPTLILSLTVVITGVIWCFGILSLLNVKITIFIALLPPLIVVIGIANCIYLLNKYHEEFRNHRNKIKALQRVISKVGLAVLFTNLTTAVGFGVFMLTGTKVLQEFGLVAFLSLMAVYLISIILIPVLFSFLKPPKTKHVKHLDYPFLQRLITHISNLVMNHRKAIYIGTIVLAILSIIGMLRVKNVGYMLDDIASSDPLYKDLKFFENNINGVLPFELIVDTKQDQGTQTAQTLTNIDLLERRLKDYPEFAKPLSISQVMKFLNQAYYNGEPRRYRTPSLLDLGSITSAIPQNGERSMSGILEDSAKRKARISVQMADVGSVRIKELKSEIYLLADSIFNYQRSSQEIVTDSIVDIVLWDSAHQLFDTTYYTYYQQVYTPVDSNDKAEIGITGTSVIFLKGNDYLISNLIISLIVAFLIISLLMAGIFTSLRMIVISLIPNLIPLLFTAGIMGYSGVNFKPSTVLVFSVAFGIAVDFSIHFLTKYKQELRRTRDIQRSVQIVLKEISTSMIYTAVILFFGFIIFVGSSVGGTIALGLFTAITLLIALLSNLLLLPSLLISYNIAKNSKTKPLIELTDM